MGFFRFRKSIKLAPGIKINLNKKSVSLTTGIKGFHHTIGTRGSQTTIGLPGTGLSYTHVTPRKSNSTSATSSARRSTSSKMSVCQNCGHRMRKQWDNCPKCHYPLTEQLTSTAEVEDFSSITENQNFSNSPVITEQSLQPVVPEVLPPDNGNNPPPAEPPIEPPEKKKNNHSGCGCIIFIILFLSLVGSCFGDNEEDKKQVPQAVPSQTEQVKQETTTKPIETQTSTTAPAATAAPVAAPVVLPTTPAPATPAPAPKQNITYIANANTGKIHREGCRYVRRMKESNKVYIEGIDAAEVSGYVPCKVCRPF